MQAGEIVLVDFPFSNQQGSKLRPALVLARLPGEHEDFLVCMISTRVVNAVDNFDEMIMDHDSDFVETGLKSSSVIRLGRLHVVELPLVRGTIGAISQSRLDGIRVRLGSWLSNT